MSNPHVILHTLSFFSCLLARCWSSNRGLQGYKEHRAIGYKKPRSLNDHTEDCYWPGIGLCVNEKSTFILLSYWDDDDVMAFIITIFHTMGPSKLYSQLVSNFPDWFCCNYIDRPDLIVFQRKITQMHIFDLINIRLYLISLYPTFPYSLKNPLRIVILKLYPFENLMETIDHLPEKKKKSTHIQISENSQIPEAHPMFQYQNLCSRNK